MDRPVRRVLLAGGGNIGLAWRACSTAARRCRLHANVRIIEANKRRCEYLASQLSPAALVLHGDATDEELLIAEGVADADLFVALTNDDENNIMSALLAKRLGGDARSR